VSAGRRRWGWHQLDPEWAQRLVARADVRRGDLVVDVGAGLGALTAPLLATGARVIAVEIHPRRAAALRARFGDEIVVVRADATDLRLPRQPFRVVANPPFSVTTALLRRLLHPGSRLVRADLILQGRVARRWVEPGAPGAGRWLRDFAAELGPTVPADAFRPPPPTGARVLTVRRR
jgi:23S rRNA (adenine-N6)-dimethyltransferase